MDRASKVFRIACWVAVAALLAVTALFVFTDVSPYMHEVVWQHSWKPVCAQPDGTTRFC